MNTNESNAKGTIICGWCAYDANPVGATHCQKCGKLLVVPSKPIREQVTRANSHVLWLNVLGLVLLLTGVGIYYFWQQVQLVTTPNTLSNTLDNNSSDRRLYNSMKEVPNVPEGVFNYGGSVVFSALTAHGTHKAITQAHPKFQLRFTEPTNNNPGQNTGITMLLDGELSFAQSSKPLEDVHYNKAKERGFALQQVPVAIDGFLLFTHKDLSIPGLAVDQIQDIYRTHLRSFC
ncbi:substrate-binding domain-containing protein [Mastigocladopsis repens]|uniref:substrate-binding domain-containing protein n=1 Tax=Mastigocladopsis repens TaxID=221287 RepID=UPI0003172EB0|nr:substrate-binding domain-containing protein [Mastigocladopsis repens]